MTFDFEGGICGVLQAIKGSIDFHACHGRFRPFWEADGKALLAGLNRGTCVDLAEDESRV
jgi:hypothetical protein